MTEELNEETLVLDELSILKQRADDMGIGYHPSIGLEKLKAKIEEKLNPVKEAPVKATKASERAEKIKDATKLVRVRIACMNPQKREWQGEVITVANKVVGTLRKFVPFDTEWHVPQFMYNVLRDRKFRQVKQIPDGKGGKIAKNVFIPEFAIEVLPQLTEKELADLAADQSARGAIDND